jgi:hypothetical protein
VQAWNGGQSKSIGFGFSREPSRAVLRMLKVYADGCQSTTHPDQGDGQRGQRAAAHYAGLYSATDGGGSPAAAATQGMELRRT